MSRLLHTRSYFSRSVMVSVGVSVLGVIKLHFVNPGVKTNGKYYRETLLKELEARHFQGCGLGLDVLFSRRSRDVPTSRLGLVSKRPRGRPRQTWIRQLEIDVGLTADAAWDMAGDRDVWRAQRPIAGQM